MIGMAQTRIKKVKLVGGDKIVLEFEKPVQEGFFDQYRIVSEEPAAPSFYDAMKALAVHAAELCELPESYAKRLTVKCVAYTFKGEEQVMGATMTAAMDLHRTKGAITLNTPHKPSRPYEINAKEPYGDKALSATCVAALWELERQAKLYINGLRGQVTLDFDSAKKTGGLPFDEKAEDTPENILPESYAVQFPPADYNNETHGFVI